MTLTATERSPSFQLIGQSTPSAYEIVDTSRLDMRDRTRVEDLDREFPYIASEIGAHSVQLLDLTENDAGTFKWRGAAVATSHAKINGAEQIVVPSAGNHARGAILAARALNLAVDVVVPTTAPHAKREGLRDLWQSPKLRIHAVGRNFDEALAYSQDVPGKLIHPYDDPHVIAGQGTVVDDLLQYAPDTERIVTPVGGGGLVAGVLQRLEELGRTDVAVYGAEIEGSDSLRRSLETGEVTEATRPNQRFGGSAVGRIGQYTFEIVKRASNFNLIAVPECSAEATIALYKQQQRDLMRDNLPTYEPTSTVAIAALADRSFDGKRTASTAVLMTGRNAPLYQQTSSRRSYLPV